MVVAVAALTASQACPAVDPNGYLNSLQESAHFMRLAEAPQWLALLHYHKNWLRGTKQSLQDAPNFFLAPSGQNDAEAELNATLAAFFDTGIVDDSHPQCRYIARYNWLNQVLGFDATRLQPRSCPAYQRWLRRLDPHRMTLVFAASFLNNPASMFGHTFLRIDSYRPRATAGLLDFAVNYAARTAGERGIMFALRGLFGGYHGHYATTPFDQLAKTYGDIENRDLWEYHLALRQTEIARVLQHVWELQTAQFDYFFLDENCAYQLMTLLDVARPTLNFADQFPVWVTPTDTLRRLSRVPGLVKKVTFRPARSTLLQTRQRAVGNGIVRHAKDFAFARDRHTIRRTLDSMTPTEQAQALDLTHDYLTYLLANPKTRGTALQQRQYELLKWRSTVESPAQGFRVPTPFFRPEQGHGTSRLQLTVGTDNHHPFTEIGFRPAYHDLMDPSGGYTIGTQLQFLNTTVRLSTDSQQVFVQQFDLVDMVSLAPWSGLLQPISWRASLGVVSRPLTTNSRIAVGMASGGIGATINIGTSALAYALAEAGLQTGIFPSAPPIDLSIGATAGIVGDVRTGWRMGFNARISRYLVAMPETAYQVGITQRMELTRHLALRLDTGWQSSAGTSDPTGTLGLSYYF